MFQDLLRELRTRKGVTQGQLAKAVGVSPGNVGDWESGKSKPGYSALATLTRFFEVSADYLLELDASPAKPSVDLSTYKAEQGLLCDGSPLSEIETDLVAMYRLLPPSHQEELFDLAHFKYTRFVEVKVASIYSTYTSEERQQKSGPDSEHKARTGTA